MPDTVYKGKRNRKINKKWGYNTFFFCKYRGKKKETAVKIIK